MERDDLDVIITDDGIGAAHARSGSVPDRPGITMAQTVRLQIDEFAATDTSTELAGVLLGTVDNIDTEPLVHIQAYIEAKHTEAAHTSVKFTHATWDDINRIKEQRYPNLRIVGWFHTHPGFGIFLSRWDMFIQENFFNLPWQIAYVVDPVGRSSGFFRWEDGKVEQVGGRPKPRGDRIVIDDVEQQGHPDLLAARKTRFDILIAVAAVTLLLAGAAYGYHFYHRASGSKQPTQTSHSVSSLPARLYMPAVRDSEARVDVGPRSAVRSAVHTIRSVPPRDRLTTAQPKERAVYMVPGYTVRAGDSISKIATRVYKHPSYSDVICYFNFTDYRHSLQPGRNMYLPPQTLAKRLHRWLKRHPGIITELPADNSAPAAVLYSSLNRDLQ